MLPKPKRLAMLFEGVLLVEVLASGASADVVIDERSATRSAASDPGERFWDDASWHGRNGCLFSCFMAKSFIAARAVTEMKRTRTCSPPRLAEVSRTQE